jgi:Flp pilus assembly protein TadD
MPPMLCTKPFACSQISPVPTLRWLRSFASSVIPAAAAAERKAGAEISEQKTNQQAATFATNSGRRLLGVGDLDGAISQFRAAISAMPTFASAHYQLGWALAQKGEKEKLQKNFRKQRWTHV